MTMIVFGKGRWIAVLITVTASWGTSVTLAELQDGAVGGETNKAWQAHLAGMPTLSVNREKVEREAHQIIRAHKDEAIAWAIQSSPGTLSHTASSTNPTTKLYFACARVFSLYPEESLQELKKRYVAQEQPDIRLRRILGFLLGKVRGESLLWTIEHLLDDTALRDVPTDETAGGIPRLCDMAYRRAFEIVDSLEEHLPANSKHLEGLRSWWTMNNARLKWSDTKQKFVVE